MQTSRLIRWPILWGAIFLSAAHAYDLKGFELGQPMESCPAETREAKKDRAGVLLCDLGPTTLANQPANSMIVGLYQGRVVSIFVGLEERGRNANDVVRIALEQKFGPPNRQLSKPHVNSYTWMSGEKLLGLDGWKGSVVVLDVEAHKRARSEAATSGKSDL